MLLLTHDTRLARDALPRLTAAFESATEFGVLAPAVELDGQPAVRSFGGSISADGDVELVTLPPAVDHRGVTEVDWVDGCAMLVRTSAARDVGPLRAGYFMYFEEAEFCDRMRAGGWRVGVVPAAKAYSQPGFASRPAAYAYLYTRNGLDWARAHGGRRFAMRFVVTQLRSLWQELPKPGGRRFRSRTMRRYSMRLVTGRCGGLVAGLLGVSGPPPDFLARTGDIRGRDSD